MLASKKLSIFILFGILCNYQVESQDKNNDSDESSSELLDVNTEFQFSSLEDLSVISQRITMSSDELEEEDTDEEEEEYKHNMKGMLDESLRWPKDLEGFVIIPYEFYKRSKYSEYN